MPELTGGGQGPFALIQPFMGESAQDKIRKYLDQQAQANAGAVAGDPNAPFSGQFAAPPTGGPAKPPPMGAAAPGPGEPAAMQTPESWGSMLMDLQQQNEAEAGFNKSIGLGLSAFAQPRSKEALVHAFDPSQPKPDPFKMGESLLNMSSMQQGQDRANQIARLVNGPQGQAIADKMGMDLTTLRAGIVTDPGLVAKVAQAMGTPTPEIAGANQIAVFGKTHGWSDQDISDAQRLITTKMLPNDIIEMQTDAIAWKHNNPNKPLPWDPNSKSSYDSWKTENNEISKVRTTALTSKDQNARLFYDLQNKTEELKSMPGMSELMDNVSSQGQAARQFAQHILDTTSTDWATELAKFAGLSPAEKQFVSQVKQLKGEQYAQAIQQLPNRFSQQEADRLSSSLGQIGNLSLFAPSAKLDPKTGKQMIGPDGQPVFTKGSDAYIAQAVNPLGENVRGFRANNIYGASGSMSDMPDELRSYVGKDYLAGGKLHVEGQTEPWEKNLDATQEVIDAAKNLIKNNGYTRSQADRYVRRHGMRPPINGYGD